MPLSTRTTPRLLGFGLVVALTTTVSGCSPQEPDQDAPSSAPSFLDSPLAEFLGEIAAPDEGEQIAAALLREGLITQCMADHGFEYASPDVAGQIRFFSPTAVALRQTEEWIVQNGYGITTGDGEAAPDPWADPNAEYLATLSPASQAAFQTALVGEVSETFEPGAESCLQRAGEADGADEVRESPEFEAITQALDAFQLGLRREAAATPEMVTATRAWSDCMADAGYPDLAARTDAEDSLYVEYNRLKVDAAAAAGKELGPGGTLPPVQIPAPALAELRERELATALADHRCREETGYDTTRLEVEFALEKQFLADNESALAELVAAYEQQ